MRKLNVDWDALEIAFEDRSETTYYLDLETGEVVSIADEIWLEREKTEENDAVNVTDELPRPDWIKEALREAARVEAGLGTRYIEIDKDDPQDAYRDMEAFIATVEADDLKEHLWRSIKGRGAFRYFRDALTVHPHEGNRWITFRNDRLRSRIGAWLESIDVEPMNHLIDLDLSGTS